MNIKNNKVIRFSKIVSILFGVTLLISPIFFTNLNKHNNSRINSNLNKLSVLNDYNLIQDAWTMFDTIVVKDTVGDIWAWGDGTSGQNGDGEKLNNPSPVKIEQFNSTNTIEEAWTMGYAIVVRDTAGDIWSWGQGNLGQNGDGDLLDNSLPKKIHDVDGTTNVFGQGVTIDKAWTMANTIIAKDTEGDIWSWGAGSSGENGDNDSAHNTSPEKIAQFNESNTIEEAWTMVSTIIAKDTAGDIWSWGLGTEGQNGDGSSTNNEAPIKLNQFSDTNTIVDAWTMFNTIIAKDTIGDIWSWGAGTSGQNGDGNSNKNTPSKITQFNSTNTIVNAWTMENTIIAKDTVGDIWSWGDGFWGQNGDGNSNKNTPSKITQFNSENTIVEAWALRNTIIAKDNAGDIWSWGQGSSGQNGDGEISHNNTPNKITQFNSTNTIVNAWTMFNTIIAKDTIGDIWVWGLGDRGQTGNGVLSDKRSPERLFSPLNKGNIEVSNLESTSATVEIKDFTNGIGIHRATKATLTYTPNGGTSQTTDDNDLTNGISFSLVGLEPSTNYTLSIQYYNGVTAIETPVTSTLTTEDRILATGQVATSNITTTSATVSANGFTNGTGDQEATKATLTYTPNGGESKTMNDDNLTDGVSFNLVDLNPSVTYDLSIQYYKDTTEIGTPITSTLTTEDIILTSGQITSSNISSTTATIIADGFTNGTGDQEANKATLTYGVAGGTDQTMDDDNLTNGVSFDLIELTPTSTYNLSIQYYKDTTAIGSPITSTVTTNDSEALVQGNLVISNVTATTATVTVEGFTNGTGDNLATKAILTYDVAGTRATIEDNDLTDGVSFNLTGLTEGQNYTLSVAYQNSSGAQIGESIDPESPLVPQNPSNSSGGGLSTGAIIGIAVGVGGTALIGAGVGGFFLYKNKRGF